MSTEDVDNWRAEISGRDFESCVIDADGEIIASELAASQARLIAAAPDLLTVCRDVKANWDAWDGKIDGASVRKFAVVMAATMKELDRTIAKAEGK